MINYQLYSARNAQRFFNQKSQHFPSKEEATFLHYSPDYERNLSRPKEISIDMQQIEKKIKMYL
jgi:hypothetical protein